MYKISDVVKRYRVSREMVMRWIQEGDLVAIDVGRHKRHLRFTEESLANFEKIRAVSTAELRDQKNREYP